jgi:hypothetical protein
MSAIRGFGFLGRTRECHRLDGVLAQARDGQSAVLVIRGEAGMGKTALLRYAAGRPRACAPPRSTGVQAEMELPYAGIHRLCASMLEALEVLAEPQQNALRVALGVSSGDPPDRFLVAVAVLNLLCAAAEERPLLCLVDDVQWLDAASVQALGFVGRRLGAEPVAMMFSLREPITSGGLDGLPQLSLEASTSRTLGSAGESRSRSARRPRPRPAHRRDPGAIRWRLVALADRRKMTPAERDGGCAGRDRDDLSGSAEKGVPYGRVAGPARSRHGSCGCWPRGPAGGAPCYGRAAGTTLTDAGRAGLRG